MTGTARHHKRPRMSNMSPCSELPAFILFVACCGGEPVKNPLVGMPGKDIGNTILVTPATPLNQQFELLRCYMSEPSDVQLTMSVLPTATPAAQVFSQPPVTGWFVVQWGSGEGMQHQAWVDLVNGVSIPLHAQNVRVTFVLYQAVPGGKAANLNASISIGTTTQQAATYSTPRIAIAKGNTVVNVPVPPFAASVTTYAVGSPVAGVPPTTATLGFTAGDGATPIGTAAITLDAVPEDVELPGNCAIINAENTDAANDGLFTFTFTLAF
jgi:hypothetical protein